MLKESDPKETVEREKDKASGMLVEVRRGSDER